MYLKGFVSKKNHIVVICFLIRICDPREIALPYQSRVCLRRFDANSFCTRNSIFVGIRIHGYLGQNTYFLYKDLIFRFEYSKGSIGIGPVSGAYSPKLAAPAPAGFRAKLSLALVPVKETIEISNSNQRPTIVDTTIETLTNCVCAIRFLRNSLSPFYCRRVDLPPRRIPRSLGARSSPSVRRALTSKRNER